MRIHNPKTLNAEIRNNIHIHQYINGTHEVPVSHAINGVHEVLVSHRFHLTSVDIRSMINDIGKKRI